MPINYWAVLLCGVLSMVIGAIWYGPLFGRKWMEIVGANPDDIEARKKMQKSAGPLYVVQFLLTLFQVWVLDYVILAAGAWQVNSGIIISLWVWAAFVMPIIAGTAMWNNDSAKISWARFQHQAGYQLVIFVMFGSILSLWR